MLERKKKQPTEALAYELIDANAINIHRDTHTEHKRKIQQKTTLAAKLYQTKLIAIY